MEVSVLGTTMALRNLLKKLSADGTSAFINTQNQAQVVSSIAVGTTGNIARAIVLALW
jgi:hypothetical protein